MKQVKTLMQDVSNRTFRENADEALNLWLAEDWAIVELTTLPPRFVDGIRNIERMVTLQREAPEVVEPQMTPDEAHRFMQAHKTFDNHLNTVTGSAGGLKTPINTPTSFVDAVGNVYDGDEIHTADGTLVWIEGE